MVNESRWSDLEAGARQRGAAWTRIEPQSAHDLFMAVVQPNLRRCLWYDLPSYVVPPDLTLPTFHAVAVTMRPRDNDPTTVRCSLTLESPDLRDVFTALVTDVARNVAATPDDEAGIEVVVARLHRWQRLLRREGARGLSAEERRGLFGELIILERLIDAGMPKPAALQVWTGPQGAHQDFQGAKGAVEVKTTAAKQPQAVVLSSERELDTTGLERLVLSHLSIDERRGGTGTSLFHYIEGFRDVLSSSPPALSLFEQSLLFAGYLPADEDLYVEPHYSLRSEHHYLVHDDFPRIVEPMLPIGVGDVRYRVQIAALTPFLVSPEEALISLGVVK